MNDDAPEMEAFLAETLEQFGCQTGTIHRATQAGDELVLVCQIGVPETLWDKISRIPFGKGIAGAAAERREAVELCNLQEDLGGVARVDARKTGVSGSLAVPVFSEDKTTVIGTLGIGMFSPHEFTDEEKTRLTALAESLASRL